VVVSTPFPRGARFPGAARGSASRSATVVALGLKRTSFDRASESVLTEPRADAQPIADDRALLARGEPADASTGRLAEASIPAATTAATAFVGRERESRRRPAL